MLDQRLRFPRILHVWFDPRPSKEAQSRAIVKALEDLPKCFTHVMVTLPAWESFSPDKNPDLLRDLLWNIDEDQLIWSRWLWPWGKHDPDKALKPLHYALAIQQVQAEAKTLGAVACGIDAEAYNSPTWGGWMKKRPLTPYEKAHIVAAIHEATEVAGTVDLVMPTGSVNVNNYSWFFRGLGSHAVCEKSYYSTAEDMPRIRSSGLYKPSFWGTHVGPGHMTVEECLTMDFPRIRQEEIQGSQMFRELYGQFVYIDHTLGTFAETVAKFREACDD